MPAHKELLTAASHARRDSSRPSFHIRPIANRMGDPNGVIRYRGRYHLFFQFNPVSIHKGKTCWGHMSSKNLIDWQYHDIAFTPDTGAGEERCFSGSAIAHHGGVFVAYTSVLDWENDDFTQGWAWAHDKNLTQWERRPSGLLQRPPRVPKYKIATDWRDPYLFRRGAQTYMLIGCNMTRGSDIYTAPLLYRAMDRTLKNWEYRGMLHIFGQRDFPNAANMFLECPNIIKIGRKWILLGSPESSVKYFIGRLDPDTATFHIENTGFVSYADKEFYYASYVMRDQRRGRHLMFAACFGDEVGHWRGVGAIPREIAIHGNQLIQSPIREMKKLRLGRPITLRPGSKTTTTRPCFEIVGYIRPNENMTITLSGRRKLTLFSDGRRLTMGTQEMPLDIKRPTAFRLFFDRSICEIFVGKTHTLSYMERGLGIKSITVQGNPTTKLKLYHLRDAKFTE